MVTQLVQDAVNLFVETLPLETMEVNLDDPKFWNLYNKECELFSLLGKMTEVEKEMYRTQIGAL